jgi:hypothetical protein
VSLFRDPKLLGAIRRLNCVWCDRPPYPPSQAAHSNLLEHGKGRGLKASDAASFPLCDPCHREFDQGKSLSKEERRELTLLFITRAHIQLLERGFLVVNEKEIAG